MISDLAEAFISLPLTVANDTRDAILRESVAILNQVVETRDASRLEIANFLICVRGISEYWRIPESLIRSVAFNSTGEQQVLDYFSIVSLVYFAGDRLEYRQLQSEIVDAAVARVDTASGLLDNTEIVCLALDLLSCPWVGRASKDVIATKLFKCLGTPNPMTTEIGALVNEFGSRIWLFDWRSGISNRVYLQKKELSLSY